MVLTAVRGAVGFLTRVPVGHGEDAWAAFRATPAAFPLAGYPVGLLVAVPLAVAPWVPAPSVAAATLAWLYVVTGVNHLDGVADLGDAVVVHGDASRRRAVLTDLTVGVGGTGAAGFVLVATGLAFLALAGSPLRIALSVVIAAEVGAKLSMAGAACLGTAFHDGLGSAFTTATEPRGLLPAVPVALPAAALAWPSAAAAAALAGAVAGGGVLAWRANAVLQGINGDVFGAANELGRVAGLHAGVIAWTLS